MGLSTDHGGFPCELPTSDLAVETDRSIDTDSPPVLYMLSIKWLKDTCPSQQHFHTSFYNKNAITTQLRCKFWLNTGVAHDQNRSPFQYFVTRFMI